MMNNDVDFLKKRYKELANKSYSRNIPVFTNFLGLMEMSVFMEISKDISFADFDIYGGAPDLERKVVRFGQDTIPYPIDCIHITPSLKKFSDKLTHRDFLGALINLGIERDYIGDIIVKDNEAFVFCINKMTNFITENLDRVKHTSVKCVIYTGEMDNISSDIKEIELNVASLRLDVVIGEVYKLSRSQAQTKIREGKAFVNGRLMENNSYQLKPADAITLRGYGRFIFSDTMGVSKKGRPYIKILLYI